MAEENEDDIVEGLSKVTVKLQNLSDTGEEGNKTAVEAKTIAFLSQRQEAEQIHLLFEQQEEAESFNKKLIDMNDEDRREVLDKFAEKNRKVATEVVEKQETYFQNLSQFLGQKLDFLREKGGAAATEVRQKATRAARRTESYLKSIAEGIGGMAKKAKTAIKSKLPKMSTLLMLGVAGAMLALMNSPAMAALKDFLMKTVIPAIGWAWDNIIEPAFKATLKYFKEIWPDLKKGILELVDLGKDFYIEYIHPIMVAWGKSFIIFFEDFKEFLKDPSWASFGSLISENKVAIASILVLLAPKLMFKGLLLAVKGIGPVISALKGVIGVAGGIGTATVLAYLGIALSAARALAISMGTYSDELAKGKPAIDALGTASREWVAEFLGWPANLAKDAAAWTAGQMGYKVLEKELDKTDMRDVVKEGVDGWVLLFKKSFEGWGKLIKKIMDIDWQGFIRKMMGTGKVGTWITKNIFRIGTVEEEKEIEEIRAVAKEKSDKRVAAYNKGVRLFEARRELIDIKKDVAEERVWESAEHISADWDRLESVTKEIKQLESELKTMKQSSSTFIGGDISQIDARSSQSLMAINLAHPDSNIRYMLAGS